MGKIVDFRLPKLMNIIKQKAPDNLHDLVNDQEIQDTLKAMVNQKEIEVMTLCEDISNTARKSISKYVTKKHGSTSDPRNITTERRDDFCAMAMNVASHLLSRALAMYEFAEREAKLEQFSQTTLIAADVMRAEADAHNGIDESENKDD